MTLATYQLHIDTQLVLGTPMAGGSLTMELTTPDVDGALVVPQRITMPIDANGQGSGPLWPNVRGTQGSQYRAILRNASGELQFNGLATMQASDCYLHDIIGLEAPPTASSQDRANGYPGLTGLAINLWNAGRTALSFIASAATAARTWTFPDKSGTVALTSDIPAVPVQSVAGKTGDVSLAKSDVGLGSVDNTSDADKPVSTAQQAVIDAKVAITDLASTGDATKGSAMVGYAGFTTLKAELDDRRLRLANYSTSAANNPMARFIQPRHCNLASLITDALITGTPPSGVGLGNSLVQGTGSSGASATWLQRLGSKLYVWSGVGSGNAWAPSNRGVGGSKIDTVAAYVAHNGDNLPQITRAAVFNNFQWFALMSIRNSANVMALTDYRTILRAVIRQIRAQGKDVVMVSEPPQINYATGDVLDDDTNWTPWLNAAKRICAEEGASFVDFWSYAMQLKANGTDLRTLMSDGTHGNDACYDLIGDMTFYCLTSAVESNVAPNIPAGSANGHAVLVARYTPNSGPTSTVSGLTTNTTARKYEKSEATTEAVVSSSSFAFASPIPAVGAIVQCLDGPTNNGSLQVQYGGINVVGFTGSPGTGTVRESAISKLWTPGSATYGNALSNLTVVPTGTVCVTGVVFIGSTVSDYQPVMRNGSESGTWSDATIAAGTGASGGATRQSATVGDTITLKWYGHALALQHTRGTNLGKFTYATDGGSSTEVDCYLNASTVTARVLTDKNLPEGWHTTVITVTAKNASSSANTVRVGQFVAFTKDAYPAERFVAQATTDTLQLPVAWKRAQIERALSGSPTIETWSPRSSTLTVGGSGTALVRLSR